MPKNGEEKPWIFDLIQLKNEMMFVAEIPGPEDEIDAKLSGGILKIKGGHNFAKSIPLRSTSHMIISECKYRNGVLTLRIQAL